jgi:hypothetical protein
MDQKNRKNPQLPSPHQFTGTKYRNLDTISNRNTLQLVFNTIKNLSSAYGSLEAYDSSKRRGSSTPFCQRPLLIIKVSQFHHFVHPGQSRHHVIEGPMTDFFQHSVYSSRARALPSVVLLYRSVGAIAVTVAGKTLQPSWRAKR